MRGELQVIFKELNVDIAEGEIIKGIKQLNVGKSGGPDHLLNEFFKHGIEVLLLYILKLFNVILELGHFPEKWNDGFMLPYKRARKLQRHNPFECFWQIV